MTRVGFRAYPARREKGGKTLMRGGKFRFFVIAAALVLALLTLSAEAEYETLSVGSQGEAVVALKTRLYELGYFTSDSFSDTYNKITAERVARLQKKNGLAQTGVADAALQELLYSGAVIASDGLRADDPRYTATPKPTKTPTPTKTPRPTVAPVTQPEPPDAGEDGFLLNSDDEFVFRDADDGHWMYVSDTLRVEIKRYQDKNTTLVWYETDVRTKGDERMTSYYTGGKFYAPRKIARDNRVVLGFTDDFFGYRVRNRMVIGIIVRNGQILSEKTKKPTSGGFPKLETLVSFSDGSMKCFNAADHTAQEYIDMGAVDVLAFGPILVTGGEPGEHVADNSYYHYREPRCALGMVESGHYIILTVKGRCKDSKGAYLSWLSQRMIALGVQEAINLDGGGTAQLIFMGELLPVSGYGGRNMTSLLGFGTSELVTR